MAKIPATEPFNIVAYSKLNNLKLKNTLNLKDNSKLYILGNDNRVDCFLLDKDKKLIGAKGAVGSSQTLIETITGIMDKLINKTGL